jgi:hypothetical protein
MADQHRGEIRSVKKRCMKRRLVAVSPLNEDDPRSLSARRVFDAAIAAHGTDAVRLVLRAVA